MVKVKNMPMGSVSSLSLVSGVFKQSPQGKAFLLKAREETKCTDPKPYILLPQHLSCRAQFIECGVPELTVQLLRGCYVSYLVLMSIREQVIQTVFECLTNPSFSVLGQTAENSYFLAKTLLIPLSCRDSLCAVVGRAVFFLQVSYTSLNWDNGLSM